jgi:hypothetical protein
MEPVPYWIPAPRDASFIKAVLLDAALIFAKPQGELCIGLKWSISFIDWIPSTPLSAAKGPGNSQNPSPTLCGKFDPALKTNHPLNARPLF